MAKPLVILRPAPPTLERIFTPDTLERLHAAYEVMVLEETPDVEERFDALLPRAFAIIGQPDLPAGRIARATELRAICNVEGNFLPNVDYAACFERGVHALSCGPAYAVAVAEYALGLALDLARGITREDRAFRAGRERYVSAAAADSILLTGARIGLIGFGNLGRALHRLLQPFRPILRIHDPWLPDAVIAEHSAVPAGLDDLLETSEIVFVLATVTADSEHLLDGAALDRLRAGARLVLVSRAAVVDLDALLERVAAGRILAAVDVWPDEPVPADHPARALEGLVLSAHRAGGIPAAFAAIGDMVVDDLALIARGLPPMRMQVAQRELVGRYRNRPVTTPS